MSIQLGDALAAELNISGTITPTASFDAVPAITTSVPGLTAEMNAQAQALANRGTFQSGQIVAINNVLPYVKKHDPHPLFSVPSYFSGLEIYSANGEYFTNFTPFSFVDTSSWTRFYYVDVIGGSDANTGLSWAQRVQTIGKAVDLAAAAAVPSRIFVAAGVYPRNRSISNASVGKVLTAPISFEAIGGRVQVGTFDNLTWSLSAGQTFTYEASRTGAFRAFNPSVITPDGFYSEYQWRGSISLVEANPGSWYTDGTKVYIRPHVASGVPSLNNARVYINDVGQSLRGNYDVLMSGFDMEGGINGPFNFANGSTNKVVLDDCTMRYSAKSNTYNGGTTVIDGAQILGCGVFAAFNSSADQNSKDGFNLHEEGTVKPNGFFFKCRGIGNGLAPSSSNNGMTCHDGIKAVSIGCTWSANYGTNSGHVSTGTQVWSVGDVVRSSLGDIPIGGVIDWGGFGAWQSTPGDGAATMFLDSCQDIGCQIGVYVGASGGGAIYLKNHSGNGQRIGNIIAWS